MSTVLHWNEEKSTKTSATSLSDRYVARILLCLDNYDQIIAEI